MLLQRLAVAAVGLPLLGLLLLAPEPIFAGVVEALLAVAAFEMFRAGAPDRDRVAALAAAAATALFVAIVRVNSDVPLPWMLVLLAAVLALLLARPARAAGFTESPAGWWMASTLYTAVLGAHFVLIRNLEEGVLWLLVLLAATFATDTGAYTVGRLVGRHLLAPAISPKKTWEGAAGGFALGALAAALAPLLLDLSMRSWAPAVLAIGLPVAAILGDLLESALKRRIGVKDMSSLLPGHGGIVDRMDSLLVTGTLLYWLLQWLQS